MPNCPVIGCTAVDKFDGLRRHIKMKHNPNFSVEPETLIFDSWGAVDYWRLNTIVHHESLKYVSAKTSYVTVTSSCDKDIVEKVKIRHTYDCHLSGKSKSENPRYKRGHICPSQVVSL